MSYSRTIEFIQDKFKNNKTLIPLHAPIFIGNEREYINKTIDSTFVSSVGEYVILGEKIIEKKINVKKAIATVNGTAALHVALQLVGVERGEEVITQALTFIATINAIKYLNAEPVFLDVDYDSMGLSPMAVKNFLEEFAELRENGTFNKITNKRIAACLPMHTFGFPVHLDQLKSVCKKWNIPIVEDSAESLGSLYKGKPTGSFGKTGAFSFNGNKIVTSGGGGMLVTNDEELGQLGKHLTTTAKVSHDYEYIHDAIGYNYRMPNLNAAMLCAQLEKLDYFLNNKRNLANEYITFFEANHVKFRKELENTKSNYWLMCVELENRKERDIFLQETNSNNISTRPIWHLICNLPMYQDYYKDDQKNAKLLSDRIVNIPSSVRQ